MRELDVLILKTLHVLSSTVLFGTGLGTAFHLWMTHRRGDVPAIASAARNVVIADWLFTASSGIVQPATGFALVLVAGYDPLSSWLVVSYGLYVLAGACWIRVVCLQIRVAAIAARSASAGAALPAEYRRAMREWFLLGWPAFTGLLGIFWLMVAKPELW